MIHVDGCREPARVQATSGRTVRHAAAPLPWYRKLWKILNQKGDPTL